MMKFTRHALYKFRVLKRHGVVISKVKVVRTVENPDLIDRSKYPLIVAQSGLDRWRVLRVVYKQRGKIKIIVTFYPGKKKQYEKK